jgi:hypothetical protein
VRRTSRSLLVATALAAAGACAPDATALEKYCDVVHQAEATYDPLAHPDALGDPTTLRTAFGDRVTTLSALASAAPDAVRADATLVRDRVTTVVNALAAKGYVAASADGDPAVAAVLADSRFVDATRRLAAFNASSCAVS